MVGLHRGAKSKIKKEPTKCTPMHAKPTVPSRVSSLMSLTLSVVSLNALSKPAGEKKRVQNKIFLSFFLPSLPPFYSFFPSILPTEVVIITIPCELKKTLVLSVCMVEEYLKVVKTFYLHLL